MNTAAGIMERNIFSNLMVKSKSPRQPWTWGPSDSSSGQPEKSILTDGSGIPSLTLERGESLMSTNGGNIAMDSKSGEVPLITGTSTYTPI